MRYIGSLYLDGRVRARTSRGDDDGLFTYCRYDYDER